MFYGTYENYRLKMFSEMGITVMHKTKLKNGHTTLKHHSFNADLATSVEATSFLLY